MPSAFLRTFRKLHLYVHKTVQKHGITSILSYINIPTIKITRFSLAKTFSRQLSRSRWTVEKEKLSSFWRGHFDYEPALTFQNVKKKKKKRGNTFYQSSLESMLISSPAQQTLELWRSMYTTSLTVFFIFFPLTTSFDQYRKKIKILSPNSLQ